MYMYSVMGDTDPHTPTVGWGMGAMDQQGFQGGEGQGRPICMGLNLTAKVNRVEMETVYIW